MAGPALATLCALVLAASAGGCEASVATPDKGDGSVDSPDTPDFSVVGDEDAGPALTPDGAPNTAPGPATVSISPEEPGTTDELTVVIKIEAVDPDSFPEVVTYRYTWFRNDVETLHTSDTLPSEVTGRSDIWRVEVRAYDGADEGEPASVEVEIVNSPPVLEDVEIEPGAADTQTLLVCDAGQRWDPDGDDVSVDYWWYVDDDLIDDEVSSALAPPLVADARYRCRAQPFDGMLSGEAAWSQEVIPTIKVTNEPVLAFQPKSLDLGTVLPGQTSFEEVTVLNIGDGPLELYGAVFNSGLFFKMESQLPLTIPVGGEVVLTVSFATDSPGLKKDSMSFGSNAVNEGSASLALLGVGAAPCLQVKPSTVAFGGAYVASHHEIAVSLVSCGALPLTIESIAMIAPSDTPFELDLSPGPGPLPWTLAPGVTETIKVRFEPQTASEVDGAGNPVDDTATLSLQLGSGQPLLDIPISGFASALGCPMPVIDVEEGHFTSPGTLLNLHGTDSFAPGGKPPIFSWAVDPPPGVASVAIEPAPEAESITYPVDALGTYLFHLKVFDEVEGEIIASCTTATWSVTVKDAIPLIVEVTWDTPGDPDQSDQGPGKGADLDLHMHDGEGTFQDYDGDGTPDTWFDLKHDLYWFDTSPEWGEPGPDGDPMLVIEDPDGAGPERIEFNQPEKKRTYTIGVHCWSSFEYGPSVPTIRIYHYESLIATFSDVVLDTGDLWEVGTLLWPKGELVGSFAGGGGPKITAGYPNPFQQ